MATVEWVTGRKILLQIGPRLLHFVTDFAGPFGDHTNKRKDDLNRETKGDSYAQQVESSRGGHRSPRGKRRGVRGRQRELRYHDRRSGLLPGPGLCGPPGRLLPACPG